MNLIAIVRDYIENMLNEASGRKALILDKETLGKIFLKLFKKLYHWYTQDHISSKRKYFSLRSLTTFPKTS